MGRAAKNGYLAFSQKQRFCVILTQQINSIDLRFQVKKCISHDRDGVIWRQNGTLNYFFRGSSFPHHDSTHWHHASGRSIPATPTIILHPRRKSRAPTDPGARCPMLVARLSHGVARFLHPGSRLCLTIASRFDRRDPRRGHRGSRRGEGGLCDADRWSWMPHARSSNPLHLT